MINLLFKDNSKFKVVIIPSRTNFSKLCSNFLHPLLKFLHIIVILSLFPFLSHSLYYKLFFPLLVCNIVPYPLNADNYMNINWIFHILSLEKHDLLFHIELRGVVYKTYFGFHTIVQNNNISASKMRDKK